MKILLVPALVMSSLFVTACGNDEPDVVVSEADQPAAAGNADGDSTTVSIGDGGVSISTDNADGEGSRTAITVDDGDVTVRTED